MSEFYVGYLPQAPPGIRHRVRLLVITVVVLAVAGAILFAASQSHFTNSTFEFGQIKEFRGVLRESPYPTLIEAGNPASNQPQSYLLVAPGKHGAESLIQSFLGQTVRLKGTLIFRQEGKMIEVVPGSANLESHDTPIESSKTDLGSRDFYGEIVDTKCFLGVMNPGEGKVHRECAALCLHGGIPPALYTRNPDGSGIILLLTDEDGKPLPQSAYLQRVGQPAHIRGHAYKSNGLLYLYTSGESIAALP
jgi:hypothetical protein